MKFEKEYFDKVYIDYNRQNPKRKLKSYLKEILIHKNSGKLLDIGCANGKFMKEAGKFFEVYGIDLSNHAVQYARKQGLNAKVAGAEKTLHKKREFDVVTMLDVIEHVPDINRALKEAGRILKSGGILVLSIPVYDKLAGKIVRKLDKDPTHIHKQSRDFWISALRQNNFSILEYKGIMRYFLFKKYYIHFMAKALRSHSPAIFLIARKSE